MTQANRQPNPQDEAWMWQALALAEQGRGRVEPNPMVGCVLVKHGQEIGRGYTAPFGGPHAEAVALADARERGEDPAGATCYVTLEPCSHFGKTPPCADALVEAHIARAVVAMADPFERVAGRGLDRLREAGIEVVCGVCEAKARAINAPYLKRIATGLPWVIVKWASTLDGRIAAHTGDSRWISSPASRKRVHQLRARVDAIMVGVGTVLADDPKLTARDVEVLRTARRVVLDPELRTPPQTQLTLASEPDDPPITFAVDQHLIDGPAKRIHDYRDHGLEIVPLPQLPDQHLDLAPLLKHLVAAHDATNVLVEGGAGLVGSLLKQNLVDQLLVFIAPKLLGDDNALNAVTGFNRDKIKDATALTLHSIERIEDDVLLDYRVGAGS
ncbi:MAG: bifunctional diaminohydroxyphosphoribosylaminopyrimidine deaminase/5-amino-6-(5-phosphoribosylamino)uracil reductase RibD [Phycisphaerales bacterium JB063]